MLQPNEPGDGSPREGDGNEWRLDVAVKPWDSAHGTLTVPRVPRKDSM